MSPDNDATSFTGRDGRCAEPIAIVGMAMRLPGAVHSSEDFWRLLTEKRSGLCDVPHDRFNMAGFHDPSGRPGTLRMNKGYFLQDVNIQQFDTSFYSLSKNELEKLDPQQRQLLEVSFECMEDAGATGWRGSNIGCYVGVFGEDWQDLNAKETQHRGGYRVTSVGDFVLGNRVSYEYNLHGPSMTVKTGCSSSLVCLSMACEAIRKGDCDGALVCGANLIFSPTMALALADQGVLSPDGICKSFDAEADGYGRGEAINAVYIKRLSQALKDGDSIRAIIRGISVNCDGRTQGMLTPSPTAQEALIRQAYRQADISDLSQTAVVECHGTGTAVGDPLEASAVANCFGDEGIIITSVKPNVGHSEGAAGLTSLIKAVLALEHRLVPPNIHFKKPNPEIPFERCKLRVPTETQPWPQSRAERISVNSFGIGGVNAHAIIESLRQYSLYDQRFVASAKKDATNLGDNPPFPAVERTTNDVNGVNGYHDSFAGSFIDIHSRSLTEQPTKLRKALLFFSANCETSVNGSIDAYKSYLQDKKVTLSNIAYTLAIRRDHKTHRAYAIAGSNSFFESSPVENAKSAPLVAWVFTGQGAQWPEMGAELIHTNSVFHLSIQNLDKFLKTLPNPPEWTIASELRKVASESLVQKAEMGHPLSIAVQIGLINVLKSLGVEPDLVLGHSSGEMAAAYASGSITAEAAMAAATFRGISSVEQGSRKRGAMAAIGLGSHDMGPFMEPGVVIACENSQCSITISGDAEQVEKMIENIKKKKPGVFARLLRVEQAFHSHHMREYGPSYEEHVKPFIHSVDPVIPFYSAVTGQRLSGNGCLGASYWRQNMERPVLFNDSLRAALADQTKRTVLIEIGPHPALKGPISQILRDIDRNADVHVGSLVRAKSGEESILHMAGKLFQENVDLDLSALFPPASHHVSDLPRYVWKRDTSHWLEPRIAREWRFRQYKPHELLGTRAIEISGEPIWRNKLALADVPWLAGHEVNGQIVFPAAGYICMAGEAIRQLSQELTFTLKNVRITTGLILDHDKVTEIVTRLTPANTNSSDETSLYEFSVTSFHGSGWIKHCTGEARASVDKSVALQTSQTNTDALPRKVDEEEWYTILNRVGFNYTGKFRGLKNISASTIDNKAVATVVSLQDNGEKYALHPSVIDQCFQLFTVSAYRGQGRNYISIAVPTFIEEIVVSPSAEDLYVTAKNHTSERGSFLGELTAQHKSRILFSLRGFKATALTNDDGSDNSLLISHMEWKPHLDFMQLNNSMIPTICNPKEWHLLEELILLCMIDHQQLIQITNDTQDHLVKFFKWMQDFIDRYRRGKCPFLVESPGLCDLSRTERLERIEAIISKVSETKYAAFSISIHRLFRTADTIFTGETHPLHVLIKDDILYQFYALADALDYTGTIQAMAHTNPRLRVLEVGAGTGGTTSKVLAALKSRYSERLYGSYTYTDISLGFMNAAKERFSNEESIEYKTFDISQDPIEQGYQDGSYDLIVGSNVVHATPNLNTSLLNLRRLLSPGGRLFLQELCPETKFINYVMGFFSGWWLGAEDGRPNEPYISRERWIRELVAAGFSEPDSFVIDGVAPYQLSASFVASPESKTIPPSRVTLLCHKPSGLYFEHTARDLRARGIVVDVCKFGHSLPKQDIVSILDLQQDTVHDLSQESFHTLVDHLKSIETKMVWATRSAQVSCDNPQTAMSLGLARTARSELSVKLFTVELDNKTPIGQATAALTRILIHAQTSNTNAKSMDRDWEYAVVEGEILVPRMHWQTMRDAFLNMETDTNSDMVEKKLDLKSPGLLHTIGWAERQMIEPGEGEVVVQPRATGLNFRDVLIALGSLDSSPNEIGLEGAGVVVAIGPGVHKFVVGDRVMYMSSGCFTTRLILSQMLCVKLDDSLTFEQGAALPCVYSTATMALTDNANIQPGQTILIHSACGGVGLAAIEIAQMLGAEIYCTVSNEDKISYLEHTYGIRRSHIFHSRDSSFLRDVMQATNDKGVDVLLNSLSGDLLHASWKCVAEFGIMIEIGKRDFRRRAKLSMEAFELNRTFVGLDLWQITQVQPEKASALLERCVGWIRGGLIKPLVIARTWEASQIQEAFRSMQSGQHIGKIVVNMPENHQTLESSKCVAAPVFHSDRSYLLAGGLGGLGRAVATWMVEHGARHLIFLSRSAKPGPDLHSFSLELASQGCEVQLVAGSVSNKADVERAVHEATMPVAGVINFSMVLRDISLSDMSFDDWTTAVSPKVQGTWNLHSATTDDLDFFILCSSYSGIVGQWGQANYAAANTFLDAFVNYRHSKGLAASVIDIGIMGEVGFVWKNRNVHDLFTKSGMRTLKEQELLDAFNLAIRRSKATLPRTGGSAECTNSGQVILGFSTTVPIGSPNSRVVWKYDMRTSIYHNINSHTENATRQSDDKEGIDSLLASAAISSDILQEQDTVATIAAGLANTLAIFLIKEEDSVKVEYSPDHIGVDSLVGMELQNWIRQKFSVEIGVMAIVQSSSLLSLADYIRQRLVARFTS